MIKKILCVLAAMAALTLFAFAEDINTTDTAEEDTQTKQQTEYNRDNNRQQGSGNPGTRPEMPEGFDPENMPDGFEVGSMPEDRMPDGTGRGNRPQGGGFAGGMPPFDNQTQTTTEQTPTEVQEEAAPKTAAQIVSENFTPIFSMVLLAAAFVFVIFYKRKNF